MFDSEDKDVVQEAMLYACDHGSASVRHYIYQKNCDNGICGMAWQENSYSIILSTGATWDSRQLENRWHTSSIPQDTNKLPSSAVRSIRQAQMSITIVY